MMGISAPNTPTSDQTDQQYPVPTYAPTWQSTTIALAMIALVASIFLVVFLLSGIDSALKAWSAIGTLVGVLTGAIPAHFFKTVADAERKERVRTEAARARSEAALNATLGMVPSELYERLRDRHPTLFR